MTAVAARLVRTAWLCDAGYLVCPSCGNLVRRTRADAGSFLVTCENRIATGVCSQHLHVLGTTQGVAIVVSLSKAEFDAFTRQPRMAIALYGELGMVLTSDNFRRRP